MTTAAIDIETPDTTIVNAGVEIVDRALREFATRNTVYASEVVDPIAEIDPVCADRLRQVTSTLPGNPDLLHARDAVDILLDLRLAIG